MAPLSEHDDHDAGIGRFAWGTAGLVLDAVEGVTRIVEGMHANIAAAPPLVGATPHERADGVAGVVYEVIRRVTGATRVTLDFPLRLLDRPAVPSERVDVLRSVLNGVIGDHLHGSRNPLAISMRLRVAGRALPPEPVALHAALCALRPRPSSRVVLLVHGLCMSDRQWRRNGHDHGEALARDLDCTPVYVHYNSGRHVSENGRLLDARLEALVAGWPGGVDELSIVAHSMGGLVTRSACHYARESDHAWPHRVRRIVFLGTPHHGAPLERAGHGLHRLVSRSPYVASLAQLGRIRSAGVTDLRHGNVLDEDWHGADRFHDGRDRRRPVPLPSDVDCHAIAGRLPDPLAPLGDGLVPVSSALGRHPDPARALVFSESRRWVGSGLSHFDLLDHADVYAALRRWLAD